MFLKISQTTGVFLWILQNFQEHLFSYNTSSDWFWKVKSRSSCPEVSCKKGVLRNFAIFTGKLLCQSLFFTALGLVVASVKAYNFTKIRLRHRVFLCELSKNFWNMFLMRYRNFLKFHKNMGKKMLFINFF